MAQPGLNLARVLTWLMLGGLSGLFGVYWDIAWHIDRGRDTFFSPPHNLIYGAMLASVLVAAVGLLRERRRTPWHLVVAGRALHPGILTVAAGAALVVLFAPADDLWHRLFGPDISLWAPMHLIGLLGLGLASFGGLVTAEIERRWAAGSAYAGLSVGFGGVLLGWSTLVLAEYEYVVPAFSPVYHPVGLAGLAAFVLVLLARLGPVPFAASGAALGYTLFRAALAGGLMLTAELDLAGVSRSLIAVLLPAGVVADLLARRLPPWLLGGLVGGAALAASYPVFAEALWPAWVLGAAWPFALAAACLGGALGGWVARQLRPLGGTA